MKKKIMKMAILPVIAAISFVGFNSFTDSSESSGGGDKDRTKNEQDCEVTETRHCSVSIAIPNTPLSCTIGFDYTVTFAGTKDPCQYSKGSTCTPFRCTKNGA